MKIYRQRKIWNFKSLINGPREKDQDARINFIPLEKWSLSRTKVHAYIPLHVLLIETKNSRIVIRWCSVGDVKEMERRVERVTCHACRAPPQNTEHAIMVVVVSSCLRARSRGGHVWNRDASHGNAKRRSAFACAPIRCAFVRRAPN